MTNLFLAALSSSRSLVVSRLVGWLVGDLFEKVTFRVLNGNLNLYTYATLVTLVIVVTVVTIVTLVTVVTKKLLLQFVIEIAQYLIEQTKILYRINQLSFVKNIRHCVCCI